MEDNTNLTEEDRRSINDMNDEYMELVLEDDRLPCECGHCENCNQTGQYEL